MREEPETKQRSAAGIKGVKLVRIGLYIEKVERENAFLAL